MRENCSETAFSSPSHWSRHWAKIRACRSTAATDSKSPQERLPPDWAILSRPMGFLRVRKVGVPNRAVSWKRSFVRSISCWTSSRSVSGWIRRACSLAVSQQVRSASIWRILSSSKVFIYLGSIIFSFRRGAGSRSNAAERRIRGPAVFGSADGRAEHLLRKPVLWCFVCFFGR